MLDQTKFISVRLVVSGLHVDVTEEEIRGKFTSFGMVQKIEMIYETSGIFRGLAFIQMEMKRSEIKKCLSVLSGCRWRGIELNVQVARKRFVDRLAKEKQAEIERQELMMIYEKEKAEKALEPLDITLKQPLDKLEALSVDGIIPDAQLLLYEGWKQVRYPRLFKVMNIYDPIKRTRFLFDPTRSLERIKRIKYARGEFEQEHNRLAVLGELEKAQEQYLTELSMRKQDHLKLYDTYFETINSDRNEAKQRLEIKRLKDKIEIIPASELDIHTPAANGCTQQSSLPDPIELKIQMLPIPIVAAPKINKLLQVCLKSDKKMNPKKPLAVKSISKQEIEEDDDDDDQFFSFVQDLKRKSNANIV